MKTVPTEADWRSEPWCLDTADAYDHFFGKSLAEAELLMEENAIYYQEDLVFMPTKCLEFYIEANIEYLLWNRSKGDSGGASCFFGLLECRHDDIQSFSPATISRVKNLLDRLASHQTWYEAEPAIYGNFAERAEKTIRSLQ